MRKAKWTVGAVLATLIVFMGIMLVTDLTQEKGLEISVAAGTTISSANNNAKKTADMRGMDYSNSWEDDGYTARGCTTGNNFYYCIYNTIYKLNLKTYKSTEVKKLDCFSIGSIKYNNGKLYYVMNEYAGTGGCYPYIESMNVDGSDQKRLGTGYSMTLWNNRIYYIKQKETTKDDEGFETLGIYSMDFAGQGEKELYKNSRVRRAVCDGKDIFFSTEKGTFQMSMNGKNRKKVLKALASVVGYYDQTLYYEVFDYKKQKNHLYAKCLKNGKVKEIATGMMQYVTKVDVLTGKIYYIKDVKYGKKCPVYQYNIKTGKKKCVAKQKLLYDISVYGSDVLLTYSNKNSDTISKMLHLADGKVSKLGTYYVS